MIKPPILARLPEPTLPRNLNRQVNGSIEKGAQLTFDGERDEARYAPTILTDISPGMPAFDEELFGPVACFIRAESEEEAFELAGKV